MSHELADAYGDEPGWLEPTPEFQQQQLDDFLDRKEARREQEDPEPAAQQRDEPAANTARPGDATPSADSAADPHQAPELPAAARRAPSSELQRAILENTAPRSNQPAPSDQSGELHPKPEFLRTRESRPLDDPGRPEPPSSDVLADPPGKRANPNERAGGVKDVAVKTAVGVLAWFSLTASVADVNQHSAAKNSAHQDNKVQVDSAAAQPTERQWISPTGIARGAEDHELQDALKAAYDIAEQTAEIIKRRQEQDEELEGN